MRDVGPASDTLIDLVRQFAASTKAKIEPECARLANAAKAIPVGLEATQTAAAVIAQKPARPLPRRRPPPEFLGQYQLQRRLGQGGMGVVYLAQHRRLKRTVAVKILPESRLGDADSVARFYREWEAVGRLANEYIVQATDAGEAGGFHFLVMEYVDGVDLATLVRMTGPLSVAQACELIRQAALGLDYVASRGLVHRDIKPSNLMLARDGRVKIMDLGLALLSDETSGRDELTSQNQIMGTADYMAPEQALDSHKVDIRADLYSLGCTLYYLLAGMPPLGGTAFASPMRKLLGHTQGQLPSIAERRADLPSELTALLERLLARDPAERPGSPATVAEALALFSSAEGLSELVERAAAQAAAEILEGPTEAGFAVGESSDSAATGTAAVGGRNRGWRRLAIAAAACSFGVVGMIWIYSHTPDAHKAVANSSLPVVDSNGTLGTLSRSPPPKLLLWPKDSTLSFWRFDQSTSRLTLHCTGTAFLEFGETAAGSYDLSATMEQIQWKDAGLFFGFQTVEGQTPPRARCQIVVLRGYLPDTRSFRFVRQIYTTTTASAPKDAEERCDTVASAALDGKTTTAATPHILKIAVRDGILRRVTWDDADLPDLLPVAAGAVMLGPSDGLGKYGVYALRATVDFRNVTFSRQESKQ